MSIVSRLKKIQSEVGVPIKEFEKRIGVSTNYLNVLGKRNSSPSVDIVLSVIKLYPQYNLKWIMTGEGEKLNTYKTIESNHLVEDYGTGEVSIDAMIDTKIQRQFESVQKKMDLLQKQIVTIAGIMISEKITEAEKFERIQDVINS